MDQERTSEELSPSAWASCGTCGGPARLCVLVGYDGGQPVHRHYCLDCAPLSQGIQPVATPGRTRQSTQSIVALAGVIILLVALFADLFGPATQAGFGSYQRAGAALGASLVFFGALLRVDLLALGGTFLFVAAVGADWIGSGPSPGLGWKQAVGLVVGLSLLLGSAFWQSLKRGTRTRTSNATPSRP